MQFIDNINLDYLAFHDRQSGLPNIHKLAQLSEAHRENSLFGRHDLLCLDLRALDMVNEAYGRETGDEMQREILRWLAGTRAPKDSLYHLGRYEFGILMRRHEAEHSLELAREIGQRFEKPWQVRIGGHEFSYICRASISILKMSEIIASAAELNSLLDRTFDNGRKASGIFIYDGEVDRKNRERIQFDLSLKHCVEQDMQGFHLHFQPIVETSTATWKGLECLCRWNRPEHGAVTPDIFINKAESLGLIGVLGKWVLENAVRQCKELELDRREGFFLSVNISPLQLMDADFAEKVIDILERHAYPGRALNLEITESAKMTFNSFTGRIIEKLRGRGISLALDDFGTGYSSFNNLKHLPVNYLKTERDFMSGIEKDTYMRYFFYVMAEISHANGMKFIAEGVETEAQLKVARSNGADYIQGYLFSPPMPAGKLRERLSGFSVPDQSFVPLTGAAVNIKQWLSGRNAYELTPNLFKLLNQCMQILLAEKEITTAFHDVLKLAGEHFGVSRAFAFVQDSGLSPGGLYEWCAPGAPSYRNLPPGLGIQSNPACLAEYFKGEEMIMASDVSKLHPDLYRALSPLDIKSLALLPMWSDDNLIGFAGFDKSSHYEWSGEEIIMLWNLAMIMASSLKREKLSKEVKALAATDIHTGTLNRNAILQKLDQMLEERGSPEFSIALVNIYKLGRINASYGHDVGDKVLTATGQALRAALQSGDLIGRFAGDEFLLIMPDCASDTARDRMIQARNHLFSTGIPSFNGADHFNFGIVGSRETETWQSVGALCQRAYERMLEQRASVA